MRRQAAGEPCERRRRQVHRDVAHLHRGARDLRAKLRSSSADVRDDTTDPRYELPKGTWLERLKMTAIPGDVTEALAGAQVERNARPAASTERLIAAKVSAVESADAVLLEAAHRCRLPAARAAGRARPMARVLWAGEQSREPFPSPRISSGALVPRQQRAMSWSRWFWMMSRAAPMPSRRARKKPRSDVFSHRNLHGIDVVGLPRSRTWRSAKRIAMML